MLCQVCNKNEATVHYTKIINGEIEELHICEECARIIMSLNLILLFHFISY